MKCKNCRHWGVVHTSYGETYHMCNALYWTTMPAQVKESISMLFVSADDATGLNVALVTGPEFSCANFQPQQEEVSQMKR